MSRLPLVSHVLIAHFDIDKGSIIKHQYPEKLAVPESTLAELMLPEGAHLRDNDSTIFFIDNLKQDYMQKNRESFPFSGSLTKFDEMNGFVGLQREYEAISIKCNILCFNETEDDWKPLALDITIRFEKQEDITKPFLVVFKNAAGENILSLSVCEMRLTVLDSKFASFYHSDGKAIGINFSEAEHILLLKSALSDLVSISDSKSRSDSSSFAALQISEENKESKLEHVSYVCSLVMTKKDASVRRGAVVYALAVVSPYRFISCFKPAIRTCLEIFFASPFDDTLREIFDSFVAFDLSKVESLNITSLDHLLLRANKMTWSAEKTKAITSAKPVRRLSSITKKRLSISSRPNFTKIRNSKTSFEIPELRRECIFELPAEITVPFSVQNISSKVSIPSHIEDDEIPNAGLLALVTRFRASIMLLFNAILTDKRVMIVGHNQPSELVCDTVLACCLLLSPPLTDCLSRAFPYCTLTNLDFMKVKGFIAGVTNPIFASHNEWWDIMLDLANSRVVLSPSYALELEGVGLSDYSDTALEASYATLDLEKLNSRKMDLDFIREVLNGIDLKKDELWVRSQFMMYAHHLAWMAMGEEEFISDTSQFQQLDANAYRINQWKRTAAFSQYLNCRIKRIGSSSFKSSYSVLFPAVRRMQVRRPHLFSEELSNTLNLFLDQARSCCQIRELLSFFHDFQEGLVPVAMCLFHIDPVIRLLAVKVLFRFDQVPEGKAMISYLNYSLLLQYHQSCENTLGVHF